MRNVVHDVAPSPARGECIQLVLQVLNWLSSQSRHRIESSKALARWTVACVAIGHLGLQLLLRDCSMVFRVTRSHESGFEDERLRHDLDSHQGCEQATMSRSLFVLVTLMTSMHFAASLFFRVVPGAGATAQTTRRQTTCCCRARGQCLRQICCSRCTGRPSAYSPKA